MSQELYGTPSISSRIRLVNGLDPKLRRSIVSTIGFQRTFMPGTSRIRSGIDCADTRWIWS